MQNIWQYRADLFPKAIYRGLIQPYALKALPVALVWFKLSAEMLTRDYGLSSQSSLASPTR
ncbi:MAG: hypothetical protein K5928_03940 [Prevotella sp.]|nr:hypothetical protein [Prevotella sp.]